MELLYILLVLLAVTRMCGELAERIGQPALAGELIGGVVLGVVVGSTAGVFPVLSDLRDNQAFQAITELGIFFLMLLGGIELHPRELARTSSRALVIALGGLLLPFAAGFAVAWLLLPGSQLKLAQALFVGTALSITAVPVSIKVLMDMGKLHSRPGTLIVSAAVFDDVLSLVILAVLTAIIETGGMPGVAELGLLAGQVVLFFGLTIAIGYFILPRASYLLERARVAEFEFSILLIVALGFSVLAEVLSMHFIIGAFIAGLFFNRNTPDKKTFEDVKQKLTGVTTGLLAPIFFASIGLYVSLEALWGTPLLVLALVAVAFAGKLIGAGLPARWMGLDRNEALSVGFGMSGRGAVELIIADIALRAGLFSTPSPPPPEVANLFSAVVIVAITTTLATPIALRYTLRDSN